MEQKTNVFAEDGKHDITITRIFDLPVDLLFTAYEEADIIEQWMGTKVLQLESKKGGHYKIQTLDPKGNIAFEAEGVIHRFIKNESIIRTFEMIGKPYGVQLENYRFESIDEETSKLTMHVIYETIAQRDQVLQLPFAYGINMAHNRLQSILKE